MGFLARSDSQEPRLPSTAGVANHPKTDGMGREELDSSFLLHVFFNHRVLSCQLNPVLCGCLELVRFGGSRPLVHPHQ